MDAANKAIEGMDGHSINENRIKCSMARGRPARSRNQENTGRR